MRTSNEIAYIRTHNTKNEIKEYYNGVDHGVWLFAYWKDGNEYVGSCGKKFSDAIKEIEQERDEILGGM